MDLSDTRNLIARGEFATAEERLRAGFKLGQPSSAALVLLGASVCRQNRDEEALATLREALELDPASIEGWNWLAVCLRNLARYAESAEACARVLQLKPGDLGATLNLGLCHLAAGEHRLAAKQLALALAASPNNPQILHNLGLAQEGIGNDAEAERSFIRAIQLAPGAEAPRVALGNLIWNRGDALGALEVAHGILRTWPSSAQAGILSAKANSSLDRPKEAKRALKGVLELEPENSLALAMLGTQLQFEGEFAKAAEMFRRSLTADPGQGLAYWGLIQSEPQERDPSEISRLRGLAEDPKVQSESREYFWYAIGRAEEKSGNAVEAIEAYDRANALAAKLAFGSKSFDEDGFRAQFDGIRRHFNSVGATPGEAASESSKPIFIVGLIRSGTTLLEQMLSAHPVVAAGGELRFWGDRVGPSLDLGAEVLDDSVARQLVPEYLELLDAIGPHKDGVTDKMPDNILLAGLIHRLLPNAKILMMDRNPVDNCLSIYTTPFAFPPEYALNRKNIATAWREYRRLADHWVAVLPPTLLLRVSYEDLTANPETTMRGVLAHCDLPWNDRCLRPQDNKRTVSTPSVWQARQPVYRTSTDRWRKFEGLIPEFETLMD